MSEPEAHEIVVPGCTDVDSNSVEPESARESPMQTPKKTPSKRKSFVERAQAESEQLLKSMGIDIEGATPGRRTRSGGAKSSPVMPVESPAKKARTTPKGKGRGKNILDAIVLEKVEEVDTENSNESKKEEEKVSSQENHEKVKNEVSNPEKETTEVSEKKEEQDVQMDEKASEVDAVVEEKSPQKPIEAMEVDSVSSTKSTPPVTDVAPLVNEELESTSALVESAQQSVEINATHENKLNTAEEIKKNEINSTISEDSKTVSNEVSSLLPESVDSSNNHSLHSKEEGQKESTGNCQIEPHAASNSEIVQTPQSCN